MIIDLALFGNLEQSTGLIVWPPDFATEMSTVGFREAYANSIDGQIADHLVVKVATLAGLALLKIVLGCDLGSLLAPLARRHSYRFRIEQILLVESLPLFPCNAKSKARLCVTRDIGKSLVLIKG